MTAKGAAGTGPAGSPYEGGPAGVVDAAGARQQIVHESEPRPTCLLPLPGRLPDTAEVDRSRRGRGLLRDFKRCAAALNWMWGSSYRPAGPGASESTVKRIRYLQEVAARRIWQLVSERARPQDAPQPQAALSELLRGRGHYQGTATAQAFSRAFPTREGVVAR